MSKHHSEKINLVFSSLNFILLMAAFSVEMGEDNLKPAKVLTGIAMALSTLSLGIDAWVFYKNPASRNEADSKYSSLNDSAEAKDENSRNHLFSAFLQHSKGVFKKENLSRLMVATTVLSQYIVIFDDNSTPGIQALLLSALILGAASEYVKRKEGEVEAVVVPTSTP